MSKSKMVSELEKYADATHEVGHDIVACVVSPAEAGWNALASLVVKIADKENSDAVFRNAVATLGSSNAAFTKFLAITTVPNKSVARLMENLSESGEKSVAFLIASLPQVHRRVMTTHLCWVNLYGEEWAVNAVLYRLMMEWHAKTKAGKE
jgi:hypothetical protein